MTAQADTLDGFEGEVEDQIVMLYGAQASISCSLSCVPLPQQEKPQLSDVALVCLCPCLCWDRKSS